MRHLPVIDIAALRTAGSDASSIAKELDDACRLDGFFIVTNHGIDPKIGKDLEGLSRSFFALPEAEKSLIAMKIAGTAWRGWFPIGGEVTSGIPDQKEGLYFGTELGPDDPRVRESWPLHGSNLFPANPAGIKSLVLHWMDEVTMLGGDIMRGIAMALDIDENWFSDNLTADPTILFRIFTYPSKSDLAESKDRPEWGVGEHTDYGLLTLLWQDDCGGLEVFSAGEWLAVDPLPNSFVCNIGDMLERLTNGMYRSTPHRVRNVSGRSRLSFPLFYDPSWNSQVIPLPIAPPTRSAESRSRWDGADPGAWNGKYGDYLTNKVSKAFPQLFKQVIVNN